MEPDRDPVPGEHVRHESDHDVPPGQPPAPGERDSGDHGQERDADEQRERDLLAVSLLAGAERAGGRALLFDAGTRRGAGLGPLRETGPVGYLLVTYDTVGSGEGTYVDGLNPSCR